MVDFMDLLGSMDWKKGNLTPETDVFYCFLPSMGGEVSGEDFPLKPIHRLFGSGCQVRTLRHHINIVLVRYCLVFYDRD